MLFRYMDDIDEHLDMLERVDGYAFKLSASEVVRCKYFFDRVKRMILEGDKNHTVLVIEESSRRYMREVGRRIEKLGKHVDGKKFHIIYWFFASSELFEIMVEKFTDYWD